MSIMVLEGLDRWIGRSRSTSFGLDSWPARALASALGRSDPTLNIGDALPPFWHHLYGHEPVAAADTGSDGHPARGGFLPPVPLQRRMWAGARLWFEGALRLGETVERRSEVKSITVKNGRSGPLVFVLVEHSLSSSSGQVREEHDIVYLDPDPAGSSRAGQAAPAGPDWQRRWHPDEMLLFRYSALTYNGHRIHYDHRYATDVEGYPGLIVHGPLLATFLLELISEHLPDRTLAAFSFRALAPRFVGEGLTAAGRTKSGEENAVELWIEGPSGDFSMRADAIFAG